MDGLLLSLVLTLPPPAPPDVSPADVVRFPPECVCREALAFAEGYRDHLLLRLACEPHRARELLDALALADLAAAPWKRLSEAHRGKPEWPNESTADTLRELRERVGAAAYARGAMPAPVPCRLFVWR